MEIKLLRKLFHDGFLVSAKALPAPMKPGQYVLVFIKTNGEEEYITKARNNETKTYKRVHGALLDVQDIGFKEMTVGFE